MSEKTVILEEKLESCGVELNDKGECDETAGENVTCEIYFQNSQNRVYYTGQVVSGCVNLVLKETKVVTAIYAKIVGRAYCKLPTSSNANQRYKQHHEILYLNKRVDYVGRQNTQERVIVQPGEYNYLFSCEIPNECPTSLDEKYGSVHYFVELVVEEGVEDKKEFQESFTVLNAFNLNDDSTLRYPLSDEVEQTFNTYCCLLCCWETEPVKINVRIPIRGYAPGQEIEINIVVDNRSNQTFENFLATVYKKIEFCANSCKLYCKQTLATSKCDGCPEFESVSRKLYITVPPTPRTETSSICSVSYVLQVLAFADCCRDDPSMEFPITIGTYPLEMKNTQTDGITVNQQPTRDTLGPQEIYEEPLNTKKLHEPMQSQPILLEENMSSRALPSTSSGFVTAIDPPIFQQGESDQTDEELKDKYRPLYPVYRNTQFPIKTNLQIQAIATQLDVE